MKLNANSFIGVSPEIVLPKVIEELSDDKVMERANKAPKKAKKTRTTIEIFNRDPYVIEAAKRRAKGKCEMPGCEYKAFITENEKPYLEGHHIEPLSDGGDDVLSNVAAICPTCHREQHYSKCKLGKRSILKKEILNKENVN